MTLDPTLVWALRLALAALWLRAALHKWGDPEAFRVALAGYQLLPARAIAPTARVLPLAELGVAVGLVLPGVTIGAALAGGGLLALYSGAIGINLARGRRDVDCGCGGPGSVRPLGEGLLARNGLLALSSLVAAIPCAARDLGGLDLFTIAAAAATLAVLHAAADAALANAPRSRLLERRTWSTR